MIQKKEEFFFMFDLRYLKKSNITQVDCIVKTPKKHYEAFDIDLIEYL